MPWQSRTGSLLLYSVLVLSSPITSFAQAPQPTSLSISPGTVSQGQCYTMTVGNGAGMLLDVQYTLNNGPVETIIGWPQLDANGQVSPCTSSATALGTYTFVAIRNNANTQWVSVSASVTVTAPPSPDFSLSISPSGQTLNQGQSTSYSVLVSGMNGFSSTVSLSVSGLPLGASGSFSPNPASPGGSSTLSVSTSTTASTGSFTVTVTGTGGGLTRSTSAALTINPRQPTSLSFNPTQGFAGVDCYVITVGNGASMTIDAQYSIDGAPQPVWSTTLDANGQWGICLFHDTRVGLYSFTSIKNQLRADWVTLSPAVTFRVLPPQPTSLVISPARVTAGQGSYRMTVGNGAGVTLDVQSTLNGGPVETTLGWPSLAEVAPGSPDGFADQFVGVCTRPGNYVFTAIKNKLNTPWVTISAPVTIDPPPAPTVTSVSPSSGTQGTSVNVTISGSNLYCSVALSTTWPGLTFSNVTASSSTSASATFSIASTASVGTATVTLTAAGGSTSFSFAVNAPPPPPLRKEYIYTGGRLVATEVP